MSLEIIIYTFCSVCFASHNTYLFEVFAKESILSISFTDPNGKEIGNFGKFPCTYEHSPCKIDKTPGTDKLFHETFRMPKEQLDINVPLIFKAFNNSFDVIFRAKIDLKKAREQQKSYNIYDDFLKSEIIGTYTIKPDYTYSIYIYKIKNKTCCLQKGLTYSQIKYKIYNLCDDINKCLISNLLFISDCEYVYNMICLCLLPMLPNEIFKKGIADLTFYFSEFSTGLRIPEYPIKELKTFSNYKNEIVKTYGKLEERFKNIFILVEIRQNALYVSKGAHRTELFILKNFKALYNKNFFRYRDNFFHLENKFNEVVDLTKRLLKTSGSTIDKKYNDTTFSEEVNDFYLRNSNILLTYSDLMTFKFNHLRFNNEYCNVYYDLIYKDLPLNKKKMFQFVLLNFMKEALINYKEKPSLFRCFYKNYLNELEVLNDNDLMISTLEKERIELEKILLMIENDEQKKRIIRFIKGNLLILKKNQEDLIRKDNHLLDMTHTSRLQRGPLSTLFIEINNGESLFNEVLENLSRSKIDIFNLF